MGALLRRRTRHLYRNEYPREVTLERIGPARAGLDSPRQSPRAVNISHVINDLQPSCKFWAKRTIYWMNLGEWCYHLNNIAFPCFTQGESIRCSTQGGAMVAGRCWQAVSHTGETETGLKNWRGTTQSELATRRAWRRRGLLSLEVPYRLFKFFEKVVSRREPSAP
jgi:hypothetical protein